MTVRKHWRIPVELGDVNELLAAVVEAGQATLVNVQEAADLHIGRVHLILAGGVLDYRQPVDPCRSITGHLAGALSEAFVIDEVRELNACARVEAAVAGQA